MDQALLPRMHFSPYQNLRHPLTARYAYDYSKGFPIGLLERFLTLPIEIRHTIYQMLWDSTGGVQQYNQRHSGFNLAQRTVPNTPMLFNSSDRAPLHDKAIHETRFSPAIRLGDRNGTAPLAMKHSYIQACNLVKSLRKLWIWDGKNLRKDTMVLDDFVDWFYDTTVIELGKKGQVIERNEEPNSPFSLSSSLSPIQYHRLKHLSLEFTSQGEEDINTLNRAYMFRRVCRFFITDQNINLKSVTLFLNLKDTDFDKIFEHSARQRWIRDFSKIRVSDRFELKVALRWKKYVGPDENGKMDSGDLEELEGLALRLKDMLTPVSLHSVQEKLYEGVAGLYLEN